jgi:hypothetical protein
MALLSRYSKHHTAKYEQKPSLNLNVEQWAADALIESYGMPILYDLLEHYFNVAQAPTWNYFAYNAEKILNGKLEVEEDIKQRAALRQKAKEWLSE